MMHMIASSYVEVFGAELDVGHLMNHGSLISLF